MQVSQRRPDENVDPPQKMVGRHPLVEIELVKQRPLIRRLPPIRDAASKHKALA